MRKGAASFPIIGKKAEGFLMFKVFLTKDSWYNNDDRLAAPVICILKFHAKSLSTGFSDIRQANAFCLSAAVYILPSVVHNNKYQNWKEQQYGSKKRSKTAGGAGGSN